MTSHISTFTVLAPHEHRFMHYRRTDYGRLVDVCLAYPAHPVCTRSCLSLNKHNLISNCVFIIHLNQIKRPSVAFTDSDSRILIKIHISYMQKLCKC